MKTNAIYIAGRPADQNGVRQPVYATDAQMAKIRELWSDPSKRFAPIKVGRFTFTPSRIIYVESLEMDRYNLPKYYLEALETQNKALSGEIYGRLEG